VGNLREYASIISARCPEDIKGGHCDAQGGPASASERGDGDSITRRGVVMSPRRGKQAHAERIVLRNRVRKARGLKEMRRRQNELASCSAHGREAHEAYTDISRENVLAK